MKVSGVYSYCFSQIFQGLCLLEGLCLLGTPEYVTNKGPTSSKILFQVPRLSVHGGPWSVVVRGSPWSVIPPEQKIDLLQSFGSPLRGQVPTPLRRS